MRRKAALAASNFRFEKQLVFYAQKEKQAAQAARAAFLRIGHQI